jgi:hypothetical protein
MAEDPTEGLGEIVVRVTAPGKYAYEIRGDRMGKYNLLSVLQLIQRELVDDVAAGVRRRKQNTTEPDKTAQSAVKIDVEPAEDYTDGVPMPKHEAIATYFKTMEKMRDRILAIEQTADDEMFVVPADLLRQL